MIRVTLADKPALEPFLVTIHEELVASAPSINAAGLDLGFQHIHKVFPCGQIIREKQGKGTFVAIYDPLDI